MENKHLLKTLKSILDILASNRKLSFAKHKLVNFSLNKITIPIGDPLILLNEKNRLPNQIVDLKLLKNLINHFNENDAIMRLNHIGFGYLVENKQLEKLRLIEEVRKTKLNLYEEESNDFGLWLFMGNTEKWQDPLVEFVPVEKTGENLEQYLPHIQIDIDTKYSADDIDKLVKEYLLNEVTSYHIAIINKVTYIVRIKLGVMDGVNIFLDLATNFRNTKYQRQKLLKKIT